MNCPSRTDCPFEAEGWNQNPPHLNGDATTNNDLNHRANSRTRTDHKPGTEDEALGDAMYGASTGVGDTEAGGNEKRVYEIGEQQDDDRPASAGATAASSGEGPSTPSPGGAGHTVMDKFSYAGREIIRVGRRYLKFVGPGFMVSVAYIDPGNYATDVAAGASYRFRLLFIILLSNIFAIFLQSLCIKLGSVTGLDLAQNCRAHLPRWLNYVLYFFAEAAIIATDIAEVIGFAIALNVLIKVPLVAGCAISIVDVMIILIFYNPKGGMRALRAFEIFVACLVLGVFICFCIQLSLIENTSVGEVFKGYLPSSAVVESKGLYQACGILGATVMPHSLYLGSGMVQPRLKEFDEQLVINTNVNLRGDSPNTTVLRSSSASAAPSEDSVDDDGIPKYKPSITAIRSCLTYSMVETGTSLFTFALFINSAILITAGASLYGKPGADTADLFGIHDLLSSSIAPVAGTIFALALLLSGTSAGIVCTIAGQMVSEGQLNWRTKPWVRRLITRSMSITPSIIIAGAVGRPGLSQALEGSQVALSVILPFVSAPLIYFTCRNSIMTVEVRDGEDVSHERSRGFYSPKADPRTGITGSKFKTNMLWSWLSTGTGGVVERNGSTWVKMRNGWVTAGFAVAIWGVIVVMNVAALVLTGLGKG